MLDIKRRFNNTSTDYKQTPIYLETIAYDDDVRQKMNVISQRITDISDIDPNDIDNYEYYKLLIRLSQLTMV